MDNPALYHNYSVYIFLTPFDSYCHLYSSVYITLRIACNLFKISSHTLFKKCFLPIDKNMDLQYTLN